MTKQVTIVGAGLAGSEAAWQLAERGFAVRLIEMRPAVMTKAHQTGRAAELVCSNSLRGASLTNAVGLLKEELRRVNSLIMAAADATAVPAGGALAVDRERFSQFIDQRLRSHKNISFESGCIDTIPQYSRERPLIIATGPLTHLPLARAIEQKLGASSLAFFDAISPIITDSSLKKDEMFKQSRYDKGSGDDYFNIPLNKEQYEKFVAEILAAEKFGGHTEVESDAIGDLRPFEGCMPIEDMAMRGPDTLRHGPLKPKGLRDPRTEKRPWAVIQLRQDDASGSLWSMVGFQTRMRHGEQQRIFRSLPGLGEAEFVRLGTVHRNTFIDSPRCLNATLEARSFPGLFFAGQMTGVEGYVESTAGGMVAAHSVAAILSGIEPRIFPSETAIGSLMAYISEPTRKFFQPMNISFGLMPSYAAALAEQTGKARIGKDERRLQISQLALDKLQEFSGELAPVWQKAAQG